MENLDIFISVHKPFKEYVSNDVYKIIGVKNYTYDGKLESYKDNVGDNISDMNGFFSELTAFYWLAKNYPLKKYVGVCSYRRYFEFLDDIPNIDEIFNEYDIILPKKESVGIKTNILMHYNQFHNIHDLEFVIDIINNIYPSYKEDAEYVINDSFLYCNNMFIMKRADFINFCEFVFNILFEFLNKKNFKCYNDVYQHVLKNKDLYLKDIVLFCDATYQSRIGGFLAERLLTIFVKHNFKKKYEIPVIFTTLLEPLKENDGKLWVENKKK